MKKVLISALVAVSMVAVSSVASAKILGSHHDLAKTGTSTYKNAVGPSACEYCHAPHNIGRNVVGGVDVIRAPLWNRTMPTGFTTYGATVSSDTAAGSGTNATALTLGQNSITCLSCHDGATGLSTLASYNYWSSADAGNWEAASVRDIDPAMYTMIGKDLRDDHPVGFTFVDERAGVPSSVFTKATSAAGGDTGMNTKVGKIKFFLYDGKFECASCHDPHDTTTGNTGSSGAGGNSPNPQKRGGSAFFLRAPIQSICTDCHANK